MTQNRGLTHLILLALSIALISAGCATLPTDESSRDRPGGGGSGPGGGSGNNGMTGGGMGGGMSGGGHRGMGNNMPQTPKGQSTGKSSSSDEPTNVNPDGSQTISQTSAIQPGPSAGVFPASAVVGTVAAEPIGEDDSGKYPVSVLPPQPQTATAPPQVLGDPPPTPASMTDPMKGKDEDFWSKLAPENVWKSIKKATGNGPNENTARAAFKEGQDLFRQKKYAEAADKFNTAADRWPDTPLEEDALFMLGESRFFADQYPKAHDTFSLLLKKYNNSRHLDVAVQREFAIGRYWERLDTYQHKYSITPNFTDNGRPMFDTFGYAVAAFQNVRLYDPTGPLADDSVMATAIAYFQRGEFESAAADFDLLRKEYPNSEFQKNAYLLGLQAKMRIYRGKFYDPTALNEAGDIADQTLTQYGAQLGQEKDRVAKARRQILEEKANRDYAMAQYYEDHKYYGSARIYYQDLIQKYPSTDRAKDARARLDAIKGLPDVPTNYFKWLTGLFPSGK
jgi:outer membrane protein assembly factor BamD (BamD/ComL family)